MNKDWDLDIFGGGNQRGNSVLAMVTFHDHQIVFNVMGNFMTKGEGATGSFALTKVGADMFFCGVEAEANSIENVWNEPSGLMSQIPQFVEFNFPGAKSPKLRIENLKFDDLDGFADRLTKYASSGAMDMTDDIKRHIRERERVPLLGLDEEQLNDMANITPTIKRLDDGRPYVLQYSRGRDGRILRIQGAKKAEQVVSTASGRIVSNHLDVLSGTMAMKGREVLEECFSISAVEKTCLSTKIPNIRALVTSLMVELDLKDSSEESIKVLANEFYTEILLSWKAEVMRQFGAKTQDLGDLAKSVTGTKISNISIKLKALNV